MSFDNPTPVKIGMSGSFSGKNFRVAGRIVLGMEEAGETYYWNEFNRVTEQGESADLVYEETEHGGEWRLFTLFEPECPMTVEDAATKRVGDPLNLDGTPVRVTLVDTTRIYHIEGKAAEGEEVGDVAHYFNAEAGNTMQVVSWTGDEIEFYRGEELPRETVAQAFGVRSESLIGSGSHVRSQSAGDACPDSAPTRYGGRSKFAVTAVAAVLGGTILFAVFAFWMPTRRHATVLEFKAPPTPITVGSYGRLEDKNYRITAHALVGIAEVGLRVERHEYELRDDDGNQALLIYGSKAGTTAWYLCTKLHPSEPMTPKQAGAVRWGETVSVDGIVAPVKELFCSTVLQTDSPNGRGFKTGEVGYGFSALSPSTQLIALWSENEISFYQEELLPSKVVTEAFVRQAGR